MDKKWKFFTFNYQLRVSLTSYAKLKYTVFYDQKFELFKKFAPAITREELPKLNVDEEGWTIMSIFEYVEIFGSIDHREIYDKMEIEDGE